MIILSKNPYEQFPSVRDSKYKHEIKAYSKK